LFEHESFRQSLPTADVAAACRLGEKGLAFFLDGGFVAEALGESIITQADTWEELRENVREAVKAFYFDRPAPPRLRLHLVRDEVIA